MSTCGSVGLTRQLFFLIRESVQAIKFSTYLGYSVAALSVLCGTIVVTGFLMPSYIPTRLRVMFGIVLLLLGIYRYVMTRIKVSQEQLRGE